MDNNVEKIKEKVDIVDLISNYLKVQKSGVNYKANCPFHHEKTPSFYVSPSRQIWHCFGCSKGGDQFAFVQEIEGVDFPEALRILARRAGIELEHFDRSWQDLKTKLLAVEESATRFWEKQLWSSSSGKKALAYLRDRGLREETIREFRLGFAPDSWDSLLLFLKDRGFKDSEAAEAGLAIRREKGEGYYDRFRSRIIFPITDLNDQIVGFTGRVFSSAGGKSQTKAPGEEYEAAKYINTPQTTLYDKSRLLYGLHRAKRDIRRQDRCLLVEGNMDVILSHQAGATEAVATSGTALTEQHLKIIKRYTNNLDLCFDQDAAGVSAMERGIALALQHNFNVGVATIDDPDCKDPADYVKKYGERWLEASRQKHPVVEFYLQTALKTFDAATAQGKKMISEKVLPFIKQIANKVEQAHWIGELAVNLKTKEEVIHEQMAAMAKPAVIPVAATLPVSKEKFWSSAQPDVLEDCLISLLMLRPDLISLTESSEKTGGEISSDRWRLFLDIFKHYQQEKSLLSAVDYVMRRVNESGLSDQMYLEGLYLQAQELWRDFNDYDLDLEFKNIFNHLCRKNILTRLADLELTIKQAEKKSDKKTIGLLVGQFQAMAGLLNKITHS